MESVHYFVSGLFRGLAESPEIAEQREELEAHIRDRIADGMERGIAQEEAFREAVASLGNLDELVATITKVKKRVRINRLRLRLGATRAAYGFVYMALTGIWFAWKGFGWRSVLVASAGFLGYLVPFCLALFAFLRDRDAVAVVSRITARGVRGTILGWLAISAGCGLLNLAFAGTDLFLHVFWSWIAVIGVMTWPFETLLARVFIDRAPSLEPGNE